MSDPQVLDGRWKPCGYEQIDDLSTAVGLTVPTDAQLAIIRVSGQSVRWRDDGTDPTAAIGMPLAANEPFNYNGDLHAIQFIEVSAGAVLDVSYYKNR